jgi:hypothetical protein
MKTLVKISFIILVLNAAAWGELILSEILSNEPSNRVMLEWIEVYNDNPDEIDLHDYQLIEGDDTLSFSAGSSVAAYGYAVICRRLQPVDSSDCFEYRWGDSTGVWGDCPSENYAVYELSFTLSNSDGSIYLQKSTGEGVDHYIWDETSDDGRSVERDNVTDALSCWHDCYDAAGSTPGQPNSLLPDTEDNYFLEVLPQVVSLSGQEPAVTISYAAPSGTTISLYIYDDTALKRATLEENSAGSLGQITWNLTADNGDRLAPGLYFILFRAEGTISAQKSIPVVIAP